MSNEEYDKIQDEEYLMFDRIPDAMKLSWYPDLCGMLYIEQKHPAKKGSHCGMLSGSAHDIAWLGCGIDDLTEDDAIYLCRCGIHLDTENGGLAIFT